MPHGEYIDRWTGKVKDEGYFSARRCFHVSRIIGLLRRAGKPPSKQRRPPVGAIEFRCGEVSATGEIASGQWLSCDLDARRCRKRRERERAKISSSTNGAMTNNVVYESST